MLSQDHIASSLSAASVSLSTVPESLLLDASPQLIHELVESALEMEPTTELHTAEPALLEPTANVHEREHSVVAAAHTSSTDPFVFTFDSGSEVHVLALEDAVRLLNSQRVSNLDILGVSGASKRADLMGHLIIAVRDPVTKET
jgi:hypothetical protein